MVKPNAETQNLERFRDLTFADFRRMAVDESLSRYERIGFPDSYRAGSEQAIFEDVVSKLAALRAEGRRFLDIGPGCSELPLLLLDLCREQRHHATLIDSPEMLAHLPDATGIVKIPGAFPGVGPHGRFDAILAYSVFHYVYAEGDPDRFLDAAIDLLAPGGSLLIGDVPNASKRRRFFESAAGLAFHKRFMATDDPPVVTDQAGAIDDAAILRLLARARSRGCDGYVLPQRPDLPMANRREDVLVVRP